MSNKEKISVNWSFDEGTAEHLLFKYLNEDKGARRSKIISALMTYFIPEVVLENPQALESDLIKRELDKSRVGLIKRMEYFEGLGVFKTNSSISKNDMTAADDDDENISLESQSDDDDDDDDESNSIGLNSI